MKKILILAGILLFTCTLTRAQETMFKALFMYNFTKDIGWPASYSQGDFVIGILGNSPIKAELEKIAAKKTVGGQKIVVKEFSSPSAIAKCHMLYIPENKSGSLNEVLAKIGNAPTVIVTDKPGLARQGAGINYVKVNGKQKFEINSSKLAERGLKVTSFLTSLGIVVQ
jgi:hypothetical protein